MCKKDKKNGAPDCGVINSQFEAVTRYPRHPFLALSATLIPFHDNPSEISSAMLSADIALGPSKLDGSTAKLLERATTEKTGKDEITHHVPTEKAGDFMARVQHEMKMTLAQLAAQNYDIITLTKAVSNKTHWTTDIHMVPDYVQCYTHGPDGLIVNNLLVCRDEASIQTFFDGLHSHTSPDDWSEILLKNGKTIKIQNAAIAGMSSTEDGSLAVLLSTTGMARHQHAGSALKLDIKGNAREYLDTWMEKATRPKTAVAHTTEHPEPKPVMA